MKTLTQCLAIIGERSGVKFPGLVGIPAPTQEPSGSVQFLATYSTPHLGEKGHKSTCQMDTPPGGRSDIKAAEIHPLCPLTQLVS